MEFSDTLLGKTYEALALVIRIRGYVAAEHHHGPPVRETRGHVNAYLSTRDGKLTSSNRNV